MSDRAAWDRVWTEDPYRLPPLRTERARSKIAAVIEAGLEIEESSRVLDLACGSGQTMLEAIERTARHGRLVACDISEVATRLARANFARAGLDVQVFCADAARLPLREQSFDRVLASMVLQHVHDEASVLNEIDRVLARNGEVFVIAPCRRSITALWQVPRSAAKIGLPADRRSYSAPQLVALMESRFAVKSWRLWHSGPDRPFSGALDRAIARWVPRWGRYIVVRCAKSESP